MYRHVRLARGIRRDEVHAFLENHDDVWELTIVTLDKPFLFSNVAGVLSYFGMDIHRGQAMTTPRRAGARRLRVLRRAGIPPAESRRDARRSPACSTAWSPAGSTCRRCCAAANPACCTAAASAEPPRLHFDNEHSQKYTVLEIVADDAPGLLHRISRVVSEQGCDLDLALIATEGRKAIDVLHLTKAGKKLVEPDRNSLKHGLERVLEAADETR